MTQLQQQSALLNSGWRLFPSLHAERAGKGEWIRYPWLNRLMEHMRPQLLKGGARFIVNAPPQFGKSEAISHRIPAWYLDLFPQHRVIMGCYGSRLAAKWGRKVRDYFQQNEYSITNVSRNKNAAHDWTTLEGGGMFGVGVGKGVTGEGGNLIIIDDPHKDWAEALSPTFRQNTIDWYDSTLSTRKQPKANIILIQCMTGDTPVLMSDGHEKPLRDISAGDEVATYNNGQLETSRVNNWINHGPDLVFTIKMVSGTVVRANARHPFLVDNNGVLEWRRLKDLKEGNQIVGFRRGHGKESSAKRPVVVSQRRPKGSATPIIINGSGPAVIEHPVSILKTNVHVISSIDMESPLLSTMRWSRLKGESVPFAESCQRQRIHERIGLENSVSIMSTGQRSSEACCATIVTSQSDTGRPRRSCSPLPDTYEIILDAVAEITESGYEDVFDIEVEHTENFIANGLVSHNTRWHESDLTGHLLQEQPDVWEHIRLPALAEEDDWLGRAVGESLCPERWSVEELEATKKDMPALMWAGLYQQRPAPLDGNIIMRADFNRYVEDPLNMTFDEIIQVWDPTFKDTGTSMCTGHVWGRKGANFFVCDEFRSRVSFVAAIKAIENMTNQWPAAKTKLIEEAANGHAIISTLKDQIPGVIPVPPKGSKTVRLISVSGLFESGHVWVPANAPWTADFIEEHVNFPNGLNDRPDCTSMALTHLSRHTAPVHFSLPTAGTRQSPWNFDSN